MSIAYRMRPIGDLWYDHCGHCSPCWVEVRAIQRVQGAATSGSSDARQDVADLVRRA